MADAATATSRDCGWGLLQVSLRTAESEREQDANIPVTPRRRPSCAYLWIETPTSFVFSESQDPGAGRKSGEQGGLEREGQTTGYQNMVLGWIAVGVVLIWIISLCGVFFSSRLWPSTVTVFSNGSSQDSKRKNVLFIIAHPDDESMFFTPTILFLVSAGHNINILCMSAGNAEGKGDIRKDEFYRACAVLRVPLQQIKIVDHPKLQDGFNITWDNNLLASIISEEIKVLGIDMGTCKVASMPYSLFMEHFNPKIECSICCQRELFS